jgi:hypothetical protein
MLSLLLTLFLTSSLEAKTSVKVEFGRSYESCLKREVLWDEIFRALKDSRETAIWPNHLSTVEGKGAALGAHIIVHYYFPLGTFSYPYVISQFKESELIAYAALAGHPFTGGATLLFEPTAAGSKFTWRGLYLTPKNDRIARFFFRNYTKKFFDAIEQKIVSLESVHCSDAP